MGESIVDTAVREIKEETDLDLGFWSVRLVGVTQDVFDPQTKHYVTLFTCAKVAETSAPLCNKEPHKCEGWSWTTLEQLAERKAECFLPLQHALATFLNPANVPDLVTLLANGKVVNEL